MSFVLQKNMHLHVIYFIALFYIPNILPYIVHDCSLMAFSLSRVRFMCCIIVEIAVTLSFENGSLISRLLTQQQYQR